MFAANDSDGEEDLSSEAVIARAIARRGEIFEEFKLLARESPRTYDLISRTAGYIHHYTGQTEERQQLSGAMRELIALCQLCAQGDDRFAANHVRRLYGLGVTNRVMFEAAAGIAAVVGWSTLAQVALAIITANKTEYPFGQLPPGGEPHEITPFPELYLGRNRTGAAGESLIDTPEWRYVAEIDPELARRATTFVDHCLLPDGAQDEHHLGPGPRELVAIAALCARGEVELAAQHVQRAYAYGMNRLQVLEAISCVLPMTGAVTLQIGARAMQLAGSAAGSQAKTGPM